MISSDKYRVNVQITLADIFSDFNDSRKEVLMKRVKLALDDLQIRMRNQLQSNNLGNLQMLLKKQQALKKMQQKVEEITQELQQRRQRNNYLNSKIAEQQAQLTKNADLIKSLQEKLKNLNESLVHKQTQLQLKEEAFKALGKEFQEVQKQNQKVEMQRYKLETAVKRLNESVHHKTEEAELILKIKEKKLEESIHQSITTLHIRQQRQKQRQEIENKLKSPKIDKRHQKIQVSMPNPPPTSRSRDSQLSSRVPMKATFDREVQTDPTQQAKIIEFIDNAPAKKEETLEEIRLVYSATPKFLPTIQEVPLPKIPSTPKITKYIAPQVTQEFAQTDPVIFKPLSPRRIEQTCQVFIDEDSDFTEMMREQLQDLKAKYMKMEQYHNQRYWQMLKIYQNRPSQAQDLKQIQLLKVTLLETQLQLSKKDKQIANQRDLYTQVTHDLYQSQNSILLKKLNVKLGGQTISKRSKFNQTCSFFNNAVHSPKRIQTQLSESHIYDIQKDEDVLMSTKMKEFHTDSDIITITKSKNSIKYRRQSLRNSNLGLNGFRDKNKTTKDYQKYSRLKITNPQ